MQGQSASKVRTALREQDLWEDARPIVGNSKASVPEKTRKQRWWRRRASANLCEPKRSFDSHPIRPEGSWNKLLLRWEVKTTRCPKNLSFIRPLLLLHLFTLVVTLLLLFHCVQLHPTQESAPEFRSARSSPQTFLTTVPRLRVSFCLLTDRVLSRLMGMRRDVQRLCRVRSGKRKRWKEKEKLGRVPAEKEATKKWWFFSLPQPGSEQVLPFPLVEQQDHTQWLTLAHSQRSTQCCLIEERKVK